MRRFLTCLASAAVALAGFTGLASPATAADSGTLSVLTYNVAGLPEAISSAPTPREPSTTEIGRRIAPYDIVHVQEDFNYHARLDPGATLAHGGSGGTGSSLTLRSQEYVTTARLCRAQADGHTRIFYAEFTTNLGGTLAGGSTTSDCVTHTAPPGWQITGFHGRSGDEVDKIGFIDTRR
ncbi:jacalin-like lectin [Streptomyces violascens]|uniref:jacalin-like lectin n=1 Tax=Streptomyces violascens TaxID=67381 RepID=UPI003685FD81